MADPLATHDATVWTKAFWANTTDPAFDTAWSASTAHVDFPNNELKLTLTDYRDDPQHACPSSCAGEQYASGEYRTNCFYGHGTYQARIRAAKGEGLVTGFFTYTDQSDGTVGPSGSDWHDEIDIEVLGRAPTSAEQTTPACNTNPVTVVHTNYFAKGNQQLHAKDVCLPIDVFTTAYIFEFTWSPTFLEWAYCDAAGTRIPIRQPVARTPLNNPDWPMQPGRVILNLWAAVPSLNNNHPFGTFSYSTSPSPSAYFTDESFH